MVAGWTSLHKRDSQLCDAGGRELKLQHATLHAHRGLFGLNGILLLKGVVRMNITGAENGSGGGRDSGSAHNDLGFACGVRAWIDGRDRQCFGFE